ncbi:MAG: transcription termination/antitermination factor NusG [Fibrobacter sp.]|jgi:transcriptional antiterminator NusG|nr:transcription termination/antitermination factor NusG [Fibrobacter sp.]
MQDVKMQWFAVHTFAGQENKIKQHLELMIEREEIQDKFGRILVPQKTVKVSSSGKRKARTKVYNLYPSYVIVEMILDELTQHIVASIPGVTHFSGVSRLNKTPVPLRKSEVDRILGIESDDLIEDEIIPYTIGDQVRIKEGPFKDFEGSINEVMADKSKIKVMVSVFGRSTPVELAFNQVEPSS